MPLKVRSDYVNVKKNAYVFYISGFEEVIPYFHLGSNTIVYNLILTDETEAVVQALDTHLKTKKKNPEFDRQNICFHTQTEEQAEWCSHAGFQSVVLTDEIRGKLEVPDYIPTKCESPAWNNDKWANYLDYYTDSQLKLLRLEGLDHSWDLLPLLTNNMYVFVQIPCMFGKWNFEMARNAIFTTNPSYPIQNIYWECPNIDILLFCREYGFNAELINNNCWLDYTHFKIESTEKIYDMVMNSRPEKKKRPWLAKQVPNLAFIKGRLYDVADSYDYSELPCKFINESRIPLDQVNTINNESVCGGIFSEVEGACYSSSEYLLAGLPVISTVSAGGRDTWYTSNNSIIVDATEEAVATGVALAKQKLSDGSFHPQRIRLEHIVESERMRSRFNSIVQKLFDRYKIAINAESYFKRAYVHKFIYTVPKILALKNLLERRPA